MKNLSLTLCLAIAALLGSVGMGFSDDKMSERPNKQICHLATTGGIGKAGNKWETKLYWKKYVVEAQKRGLNCGVYLPHSKTRKFV